MFSNNDFSNLVEKNLRGTKGYFDPNREKPQRGRPNHFCPAFMENLCGHLLSAHQMQCMCIATDEKYLNF
jgi:hypothetical protein